MNETTEQLGDEVQRIAGPPASWRSRIPWPFAALSLVAIPIGRAEDPAPVTVTVPAPVTAQAASAIANQATSTIAAQAASAVAVLSKLNEKGSAASPLVVTVVPKNEKDWTDYALFGFNGAIAIFTIVLGVWTIKLSNETRRLRVLAKQQGEDTKESIRLAKLSSDAAVALELPLFVIERVAVLQGSKQAQVDLGNHGRTPAIILADCLVFEARGALDAKPRYPIATVQRVPTSRIVGPGQEYEVYRKTSYSDDEWAAALGGKTILWAYGYVEYLDFLKYRRRLGFCVAFEPIPSPLYPTATPSDGRWVQEGSAVYTYDRLVAGDDVAAPAP